MSALYSHIFSVTLHPDMGKLIMYTQSRLKNFVMENFDSSFQFSANGAETRPHNDLSSLHRKLELHMHVAMCLGKCTVIKF